MSIGSECLCLCFFNFRHFRHHHQKYGSVPPSNARGAMGTHSVHRRHENPTSLPYSTSLLACLICISSGRHSRSPCGLTVPSAFHGGMPFCREHTQSVRCMLTRAVAGAGALPQSDCRRPGPCARVYLQEIAHEKYTTAAS